MSFLARTYTAGDGSSRLLMMNLIERLLLDVPQEVHQTLLDDGHRSPGFTYENDFHNAVAHVLREGASSGDPVSIRSAAEIAELLRTSASFRQAYVDLTLASPTIWPWP